ncbi:hypothetical protein BDM02DRAFT_3269269 [Thelephora ganbajun]|uniref:Uncharacterized protein n=1 Tax=Thelephora ganbajun TaxID=370292 RepID=A0ACB6ZGX5_THEGA|nr:hypothetical protein BDM02DRAFT_3269269 [Thelephora ganbajun]
MTLPIASIISSAIERVQQQTVSAALVYTTHERWPLSLTQLFPSSPLRISILDSSFNPPTLAHLALANAPNPFSLPSDYDAKLLLLSVRNADKLHQEGDAALFQRAEMMSLLATRIHHNNSGSPPNIAVGLVNEPTLIAKSSALRRFLHDRLAELTSNPSYSLSIQFTFLMGFDTLERVLAPRYYPSEGEMHRMLGIFLSQQGDDARIICARRFVDGRDGEIDSLPGAKPYLETGR